MTSPVQPFIFDETSPVTAKRVTRPEDAVSALIYASVVVILISRVLLQLLG